MSDGRHFDHPVAGEEDDVDLGYGDPPVDPHGLSPDQAAIVEAVRQRYSSKDYPWKLRAGGYGWRQNPFTGEREFHAGIDILLEPGTPVLAVWSGKILRVDRDGVGAGVRNGNAILLSCPPWEFAYLHLAEVDVAAGQFVDRCRVIGRSGATGYATGPHLHFACYLFGYPVDPHFLYPSGTLFVGA